MVSTVKHLGLVEVEVGHDEAGGPPPSKLSRKTDPCFEARQLVLDICRDFDDLRSFNDFYNVLDEEKGHCEFLCSFQLVTF
jgi:hypothetical protein